MEQLSVDGFGPNAFILAPDGEFSVFDPDNDQIWALSLEYSDVSPFQLCTTYQLRARSMRVFPNIIVGHRRLTHPDDFSLRPTVTGYTPSTLELNYALNNGLHVRFCCFIAAQDLLAGRITIHNTGSEAIDVDCELAAILIPMGKGVPTHPEKINSNQILCGETEQIFPVLFMSGGPVATTNPYPALCSELHLEPGQSEHRQWALVSKTSQQESLAAARKLVSPDLLQVAQTHTKAHANQIVSINTGNPDWDSTFTLAQVNALTHLVYPDPKDHQTPFIRTRLPDQPVPAEEFNAGLNDLTLLDILHLFQVLLPSHPDHLTRLVEHYLDQVDDQGCLPSSIYRGISGRQINECPLLAQLCLTLYEINDDADFLAKAFPTLQRFFDVGWLAQVDPNLEALPHWATPAQLQLESGLFNFDIWEETGNGVDIRTAESPALAAMLVREASAIEKIARALGDQSARARYGKIAKKIHEKLLLMYDSERQIFSYRDRQSHLAPARELYYPGRVQPTLNINKHFILPQRLHLKLISNARHDRNCWVRIEGSDANGEKIVEGRQVSDLPRAAGHAHFTSQHLYSVLDSVVFEGFQQNDRFLIETADYTQADISCLLPVWSGGLQKEQLTAIIANHLDWQDPDLATGIPETWRGVHPLPEGLHQQVNIQWNTLIIEGLVKAGHCEQAIGLFTNLMATIIHGLKNYNGFYPSFDIETGLPQGQTNAIHGLAPLGLCLQIAGIKLHSPDRVAIWGSNPFPWPIEVRWQGLWLCRESNQTQIIFPDGTHYHSQAEKPLVITSSRGQVSR